ILIHPVIVIAIINVHRPCGIITINKITTNKYGTPDNISAKRIIYSSTLPPKYPETEPHITPIIRSIKAAVNPMNNDIFAPYHVLANKSLPKLSVPNQCSLDGDWLELIKSLS